MSGTHRDPYERLARAVEAALDRGAPPTGEEAGNTVRTGSASAEEAPRAAPEEGRILGPYRIEAELGRGGQSEVHLATDTRLGRRVALKLLRAPWFAAGERAERFRREALIASRLDHPGICSVYEAGVHDGIPFIAMRHVEGRSLAAAIGSDAAPASVPGRGTILERAALVEEMARALHAAHEAGIVHRDLKPANVMVTPEGKPVILDFGLARDETGAETLTRSGAVFGTPAYMALEQVSGKPGAVDRRTDVYAAGVTLYEAVVGRRPFDGPTTLDLYRAIREDVPVPPHAANRAVPRDLSAVIVTAMAREPARRYVSARALAEDLARVRERRPVLARAPGPLLRLARWVERRPAAAASLLATVLSLSVGLAVALRGLAEARQETRRATGEADRAEANLASAFEAVDRMLSKVEAEHLARHPALRDVRQTVLDEALRFYQDLIRQRPHATPAARFEIARAEARLAHVCGLKGDVAAAEAHYRSAMSDMEGSLAPGGPDPLKVIQDLASCGVRRSGLLSDALKAADGEAVLRGVLAAAERVRPRIADSATFEQLLAGLRGTLGDALQRQRRFLEAADILSQAVKPFGAVPGGSPSPVLEARIRLNFAIVLAQLGEPARAEAESRRALRVLDGMPPADPVAELHALRASILGRLPYYLRGERRLDDGLEVLREARAHAERAVELGSAAPKDLLELARIRDTAGRLVIERSSWAGADEELSGAIAACRRSLESAGDLGEARFVLTSSLATRGFVRLSLDRVADGEQDCRESLEHCRTLLASPATADFPLDTPLRTVTQLVRRHRSDRGSAGVAEFLDAGLALLEPILTHDPAHGPTVEAAAEFLAEVFRVRAGRGEPEAARAALDQALSLESRLSGLSMPYDGPRRFRRARLWAERAAFGAAEGNPDEVLQCRDGLLRLVEASPGAGAETDSERCAIARALLDLAEALFAGGDHAAAATVLRPVPALAPGDAEIQKRAARSWVRALRLLRDDAAGGSAGHESEMFRNDYAAGAIANFRALETSGSASRAALVTDPAFAALRDSRAFAEWIASPTPKAPAGAGPESPGR